MTPSVRQGWAVVAAWPAVAWAVSFALLHAYWLAGGTAGLPEGRRIVDNTPLLVTDIASIPACVVAAALGLAMVSRWGRLFPRMLLLVTAWALGAGLVLHSIPVLPDWVMLASDAKLRSELNEDDRFAALVYEPWFIVGGVLFCVAALGFQRRTRTPKRRIVTPAIREERVDVFR
jgi:hypothetical protein